RQYGLSSEADLEHAEFEAKGSEFDLASWKANLEKSQAEIRRLEAELDKTKIRAPFAGMVGHRYIRMGQGVSKSDKCFRISQLSPLLVQFQVPESAGRRPERGATVSLSLVGDSNRALTARIVNVGPTVDPSSDSYNVTARLTGPDLSDLRPGMSVRVDWPGTPQRNPYREKSPMRFGPTSLQVSSVLSKGLRRPKLRSDLRISEQTVAGEKSFVVKNRETNSYNRYGASEYELLTLCDGTRTPAEIAQEMTLRDPEAPLDEAEVLEFLDSIDPAMWERSLGEKNLAVLERIRDERKNRLDQSSVLYISFKAWDPDKTLTRIDPYLGWMFTRGFVLFSLVLFITVGYLLAADWSRVQRDTEELYSFANKTAYDLWAFWLLFMILGAVHEFGHGLTCKHFGGAVPQMGFLLIYFPPAFFTDTPDITLFERVSRRQWVIF